MLRHLLRNLNIINLLLIAILVMLARYTLYPPPEPKVKINLAEQQKSTVKGDVETKEGVSSSHADYMVIAEENPFHPERKIPVEKKAEKPLPKPDFVLYGTLITDDLRLAYMEDKKAPVSTPGRGNRQTPLRVGQSLSGFTLKEIEAEKVVMVRGEETMTVYLNDPNVPKKRETTTSTPAVAEHPPQPISTQQPITAQSQTPTITPLKPTIFEDKKSIKPMATQSQKGSTESTPTGRGPLSFKKSLNINR